MRNPFARLITAATLIYTTLCAPAGAFESYLYLGYKDAGKVYRLSTGDQNQLPTGFIFACDPGAEAFMVDKLRNYRFVNLVREGEFTRTPGYIYRQVFDGLAVDADRGRHGHSQHQDQRSSLVAGADGQPVFRPAGAPFSAGPGHPVSDGIARTGLSEGEYAPVEGRSWYKLPNGSWYQTWFPVEQPASESYKIFYDCWQEQNFFCQESIWRGFVPGRVFERKAGKGISRRFFRAAVDGAMEILPEVDNQAAMESVPGFACYHDRSGAIGEGSLLVHTWTGKDAGAFFINGEPSIFQPTIASKAPLSRFVGMNVSGSSRRIYVVGTDVLHDWLRENNIEQTGSECSLAVFCNVEEGRQTRAFIYSAPEKKIYCFSLNENGISKASYLKTIVPELPVQAMHADSSGNLYIAGVELSPSELVTPADFAAGFESLQINEEAGMLGETISEDEFQKKLNIKGDLTGRIVFSQTGNAVLMMVYEGDSVPVTIGRAFLNKKYMAREFSFKNQTLKGLHLPPAELLRLTEKPGNTLAELQGNVPGFPDEFVQPEKLLISVHEE